MSASRALGWAAFVLGTAAAFAGSPHRGGAVPRARVDRFEDATADLPAVSATQLAEWIRSREPGLRVIDLRSADAFEAYRIPGARRHDAVSLDRLASSDRDVLVLVSADGRIPAQAGRHLRNSGAREILVLHKGVRGWLEEVINPVLAAGTTPRARQRIEARAELSRYFGGQPRIGTPGGPSAGKAMPATDDVDTDIAHLRRRGCG